MSDHFSPDQLTHDAFLGGRLRLSQPKMGYRAGVDPVLLAASVPAKPGQSLLDLGCGAGAAMLCVAARVPGVVITGLELQHSYAALARHNAHAAGIQAEVITGSLAEMPGTLRQCQFDHVIANPPYFDRASGVTSDDPGREKAMGEVTPLADWVKAAAKRCAPKGMVTMIQRADRMPEMLSAFAAHLGSIELLPLVPRRGKPARLALIRGRKGGRAAFLLHDGWMLHAGAAHPGDRENYTSTTACILRDGAALPFP
ncbi:MAG: tRNA1(Val) (adenine(37)-N6)-methyltransferase [Roseovarius sp.]